MSKTDLSRNEYNRKARGYENTPDGRFTRPIRQLLINEVQVKNGQSVLDVACGPGDLIATIARKASVKAYGIDIAEQMIAVAKENYKDITFSASPAYPLPFEDSFIDIITVSAAFHHFEEPQQFAHECSRVLKGGGKIYVADPYFPPVLMQAANLILPLLRHGDVKIYSHRELSAFYQKAGFNTATQIYGNYILLKGEKAR